MSYKVAGRLLVLRAQDYRQRIAASLTIFMLGCDRDIGHADLFTTVDFANGWSRLALLQNRLEIEPTNMSEQQNQSLAFTAETVAQPMSRTMYFPVSPLKLVIMATCTFGLYEFYWFYRHWCCVQEREKTITPFARAFFTPLFCYSLFKRIQATGKSHNVSRPIAAGPLAAGWIVFTMLVRLPDPFWIATFLAVLFLVPVQMAVNEINLATNPNHDLNNKFSKWNIAAVVIGGLLFVFALVGTFLPSK
jgi:hypothetical protein